MSLLYWTMLPWLWAAPLANTTTLGSTLAPTPVPRPLLLLADPCQTSLEQQVVRQALVHELLGDAEVQLVADAPVSASLRASAALRQAGSAQLELGWERMRGLHPERAAICAAMATQKFSRVAARSGDVGPLLDALALQAASYLHAGSPAAAQRVLLQLLALRPDWAPEGWLYNPDMQRAVARARRALRALPCRTVTVTTRSPRAAVFVDGVFAGFGDVSVELSAQLPHYLWALPPHGEPVGSRVVVAAAAPIAASADDGEGEGDSCDDGDDGDEGDEPRGAHRPTPSLSAVPLTVHLVPRHYATQGAPDTRYASVFAAARAADGLVEPSLPALAAASVGDVWVLAYARGALTLTRFDLTTGRRSTRRAEAVVTNLWEARDVARLLLAPEAPGESAGPPRPATLAPAPLPQLKPLPSPALVPLPSGDATLPNAFPLSELASEPRLQAAGPDTDARVVTERSGSGP